MARLSEFHVTRIAFENALQNFGEQQRGRIEYYQNLRPNPLTGDYGLGLQDIRALASVPALRVCDAELENLFSGMGALHIQTGEFTPWAHDLAAIFDLPVETLFGPTIEFHNHVLLVEAAIGQEFNHAIGEHCKATGRKVSIAPIYPPFEDPAQLHELLHPRSDQERDNIVIRGVMVPIDEALEIFDYTLAQMYPKDERSRSLTSTVLQLQHGFDRLNLGQKESYTVAEISKALGISYQAVRFFADDAQAIIRTRMILETRDDALPKHSQKPQLAMPISAEPDSPITSAEFQAILLAAEYQQDPKIRLQDLLDEAKLIRRAHKAALARKQTLGKIWEAHRTDETTQDFTDAIERVLEFDAHIKDVIRDIEKLRILSAPVTCHKPAPAIA